MRVLLSILSILLVASPAVSADRTATFSVSNMTCALCPMIVETALGRVTGVKSVATDFQTMSAVVVFDDAQASVDQLAEAVANAGYPAQIQSVQ